MSRLTLSELSAEQRLLAQHNITPLDKRATRVPMFVDADVNLQDLTAALRGCGLALARDKRDPWKLIVSRA